jgi:hypothetical protein
MVCTSEAARSVAALAEPPPLEPEPGVVVSPGIPGILRPDGVGVALDEPPQPARAATAAMEMAPRMTGLADIEVLVVVRQRSLRAESPQMIAGERPDPIALPNREMDCTLVQSN